MFRVCQLFVCSLQPRGHLLGKGCPLGTIVCYVFIVFLSLSLVVSWTGMVLDCTDFLIFASLFTLHRRSQNSSIYKNMKNYLIPRLCTFRSVPEKVANMLNSICSILLTWHRCIISWLVHKIFYLPSTFGIYRKFYRNFASSNVIMKRFALSYWLVKWLWYRVYNQKVLSSRSRMYLCVFFFNLYSIR